LFSIIFGWILIRSVKQEVEQRERIERLAKDLEKANEKLTELDKMKSEFLSLATHQIRAPLTAIKGYSSMLLEGDFGLLPPKAHTAVDTVMKSCQNLIDIVNDFLNISRIEQGRMVYEKSLFDIRELISEITRELKPNIDAAHLVLNTHIQQTTKINVRADRGKIKQVIGNIIDNAIKYTPKGSITIEASTSYNRAYIRITDTGVGIDPGEIGKLFNKFVRAKDANKTNVIGTGLGLYIAKKMIEAHEGEISVHSEGIGKGTTFLITLPTVAQ
jgi:signal transduction histidine kinase